MRGFADKQILKYQNGNTIFQQPGKSRSDLGYLLPFTWTRPRWTRRTRAISTTPGPVTTVPGRAGATQGAVQPWQPDAGTALTLDGFTRRYAGRIQ